MCMCWNFDENGKVTGMCDTEELSRRIHDPNYMPELKVLRRKLAEERAKRERDHFAALPGSRKEELREEWEKFILRRKTVAR